MWVEFENLRPSDGLRPTVGDFKCRVAEDPSELAKSERKKERRAENADLEAGAEHEGPRVEARLQTRRKRLASRLSNEKY